MDTYNTMTVWHLKDLLGGKRRMIKSKEVKHLHIPQFEGLSTADILEWAKRYPAAYQALPSEPSEILQLHRQYVINLIYTTVGDDFSEWVDLVMRQRNKRLAEERNMNINMDPEIAIVFRSSTTISGKYFCKDFQISNHVVYIFV